MIELANTCLTTYRCVGNQEEIHDLYRILLDAGKTIGHFNRIDLMLLSKKICGQSVEFGKYGYRGHTIYFHMDFGDIVIVQETAWAEADGFRHAIESRFKSIKVYVMEEELGCGVYVTNDTEKSYFGEDLDFLVDYYTEVDGILDGGQEYFESVEDVVDFCVPIIGCSKSSDYEYLMKELKKWNEQQDEYFINVHRLERREY